MEQTESGAPAVKALWRRIVDFPLVALIVALALFILSVVIANQIGQLLPAMDRDASLAVNAAISIAVALLVYKLAIRHLGDRPRDDLRLADMPKGLGIGLLFGAILFAAVVGVQQSPMSIISSAKAGPASSFAC